MISKSVVLALAFSAATFTTAVAQQAAVTNAIMLKRAGTLDKARIEIDKAVLDEKTGVKSKTWFERGEIYSGIIVSPLYSKTAPANATQTAYESYQKAIEFEKDEKKKEYTPQAQAKLQGIYGMAFNDGVKQYNAQDYPAAIKSYELASSINPQDTSAVLYSAYAYEAAQNGAGAEQAYRKVLAMGHKTRQIYSRLMTISQTTGKTDAQQLEVVREAMVAYPNTVPYMLQEISLMLKMGKEQEAITKIQAAIAADPSNSNLYAVLGSLYDKMNKPELAVETYTKAITADPANFDAQFNLGVYQFNKGADLINKARKMSAAEYTKSGKKTEADSKAYFEKAIPYFEAANKLKACERSVLQPLQKAYVSINKLADAERVQKLTDDCDKTAKKK